MPRSGVLQVPFSHFLLSESHSLRCSDFFLQKDTDISIRNFSYPKYLSWLLLSVERRKEERKEGRKGGREDGRKGGREEGREESVMLLHTWLLPPSINFPLNPLCFFHPQICTFFKSNLQLISSRVLFVSFFLFNHRNSISTVIF